MRFCRQVLWLAVLPLCGCTIYRPREVEVAVRDAETHQPIAGANVLLSNPHIASEPVGGTVGPVGIALVSFRPTAGEPVMIEASASGYVTGSQVIGETALAAVPPVPMAGHAKPRAADFVVELYRGPKFGVEIIVPPAYHGLVRVDLSFREEIKVPPGERVFPFTMSPTGEVKGTGPAMLEKVPASEYMARTTDGTPVGDPKDPDGMNLRWLRRENGADVFVLGTKSEFDQYHKDLPTPAPTTAADTGKKGGKGGRGGGRRGGGGGSGG